MRESGCTEDERGAFDEEFEADPAATQADGCVRIGAQLGELLEATYPVLLRATTSDGRVAG